MNCSLYDRMSKISKEFQNAIWTFLSFFVLKKLIDFRVFLVAATFLFLIAINLSMYLEQ
jgi:hypothetical protein